MLGTAFYTSRRVTDVEVVAKRLEIDRYLQLEGNYKWAVGRYEQLAKAHPSASVLAQLGVLYFQADPKNQEIAIATLDQARLLDPKSWEVYRSLTYVYTASNQTKDAIEAGKIALALDALDSGTYNNLAWCYSPSPEQPLDVGELQFDIGRTAVIALSGIRRHFHLAQQGIHFLRL